MRPTAARWTRREFLRGAASAALVGTAGGMSILCGAEGGRTARVVLVRDPDALDADRRPRPEVVARMLDLGVAALLGAPSAAAAWERLVRPGDTVGIKSNVWRFLPTPREIEDAIRRRVLGAGVPAERIGVDDRGVLKNPLFRRATALVNVRPMRTHHWAGVGSCIKNYIMFSPDPPSWHDHACANLGGLWELPAVRGKTRLNVLVMLTPLFHGKGPHHFQARYTWPYRGLIVGSDPVAVDATGLRILEAKRREYFGDDRPFAVPPRHIRLADERYRLGVADPSRIEVARLGWTEGTLI
ncbi:MAG: DUF362 domain-containing protein [Acidobacteriota bacterium]